MRKAGDTTIGILHPGAMGATVGAAAGENVARVLWVAAGRSQATCARADAAGFEPVDDLDTLARRCDVLLGVCPPSAAVDLAERIAKTEFAGTYVDANAVSPDSARRIESVFDPDRVAVVDGGLIGPPAKRAGTTTLHLSGQDAARVAACFERGPLETKCVAGAVGAASALKMAFAAYTKGSLALLASTYSVAHAEGVDAELLAEWERLVPEALGRLRAGVPNAAAKAWRFEGEMLEIAATFEAAGLPGGFHRSAAQLYARLSEFKDAAPPPDPNEIADHLLKR